jgi:hypothetical protein
MFVDVHRLGRRYLAGAPLRELAAEAGWQPSYLQIMLSKHGYKLPKEELSRRRAAAARIVGINNGRDPVVRHRKLMAADALFMTSPVPHMIRLCLQCKRKFEASSRFIRMCEPCKAVFAP